MKDAGWGTSFRMRMSSEVIADVLIQFEAMWPSFGLVWQRTDGWVGVRRRRVAPTTPRPTPAKEVPMPTSWDGLTILIYLSSIILLYPRETKAGYPAAGRGAWRRGKLFA